ncbi:MAG: FtsH protease activity modulator HflK [Candidatus Muiribacteriota bacterium]
MQENEKKIKIPEINTIFLIVFIIALLIYFSTTIFTVNPNEMGVVKRFGAFNRLVGPGLRYRLPEPFESVIIENVTNVRRLEVGFRTISENPTKYRNVPKEALMLTGDESIVSTEFIVQYRIRDVKKFVFRIKNFDTTLKKAAEASMRQVVGERKIDDALTHAKNEIQVDTLKQLQELMDTYESGIQIISVQLQDVFPPEPVISSFKDVASAREDRNRFINEANSYRNEVVPEARGEAHKIINESKGRAARIINTAKGDTMKFLSMFEEFENSKILTGRRIYYEKITSAMENVEKVIIEDEGKDLFNFIKMFNSVEGGTK